MAIRTLWRYLIGRSKTVAEKYNAIERAEKVMEREKPQAAPRHPGTEAKFQVLVKGNPELRADMEKKPTELLDRLKVVKVTSEGITENLETTRPLPQSRDVLQMSTYGYPEPKFITEGKCTLKQALEFITKHQNDPNTYSIETIASTYKLKPTDVETVISHFRAFELFISRESAKGFARSTVDGLGINKVRTATLKSKFAQLDEPVASTPEKK